ncbi:MAG TPA: outer membrane protein assembly factor BamB [Burkholderiales bacterium]|nr:outer membrane protein assembly factor BamB [Burkholderiales bacterium]
MSVRRIALAAAACVALGACSSDAPKPTPLVQFKPKATVRVVWRASIGSAERYLFRPAVSAGAVFAASNGGDLARFDLATGRQVWRVNVGAPLSGGVGIGAGSILVGGAKGEAFAYDIDGKPLWRTQVSSTVLSAPAGQEEVVVVRSGDGKVFGLDAKDGARKWEYQAATPPLTLRAAPGMVIEGNAVVAGFPGGKLATLNLQTGAVLWEMSVATPKGENELERIADIAGTPLVESDRVCAVTFQGRIGCFETQRGSQVWARAASSAGSPSADGTTLYYTEATGAVIALDKTSGASIWKQEKLLQRGVSSPLAFQGYVVVGDFEGYVHVLSREDGSFLARIATDGGPIMSQPVAADDKVLIQTRTGHVYALSIR